MSPFMEFDSSVSSEREVSGYELVKYFGCFGALDSTIGEAVDHEDQQHFDVWLGEGCRTKKDQ